MASGPQTGLAEIRLPDLQPGSSIMPGKVNPVIPEAVSQVVAQVYGNDAAVAFAGSQGNFELNVFLPVMARNLLESIRLLANVSRLFADRCLAGLEADVERCRTYAEATPQAATALNRLLGYEKVAELVKESARDRQEHPRPGARAGPARQPTRSTRRSTSSRLTRRRAERAVSRRRRSRRRGWGRRRAGMSGADQLMSLARRWATSRHSCGSQPSAAPTTLRSPRICTKAGSSLRPRP